MTTLTAQQIACVYAWLAQLFSRELDDEQLTQIASAQMAEWFSLLKSEPPLTAAVND
ncbi:TPA: molecular chaperone TorD, partial [Shigella flexneri]|nr:molecular chaperone TorD [Shigella flexneri]HCR8267494.1 molecular chaperone TorD [Shigella flexneri]HCR8704623.1 molecular chaperone TorD [Shigella flexneri]